MRILLDGAVALLVAGGVFQAAEAQNTTQQPAVSNDALVEIVVTAQRRPESLQNVPIDVTVVSGERLVADGILNTQDLAAVTPGLTFVSDFQFALPHIRGVGNTTAEPGAENSVAVYLDDVYLAAPSAAIFSLNSVSQIDVLKGPQGTLFGRNATGGLIQVNTRDPSQTPSVEADVTYGNYQTSTFDLYATSAIATNLGADISFHFTRQGDGWGKNLFNGQDTYQLDRDLAVRSKWVWTPGDGTKVKLSFDFENSSDSLVLTEAPGTAAANPFYPASAIIVPPYYANVDDLPVINHKGGGVSLRLEQALPFAEFISTTAYRRSTDYFAVDFDVGPAPIIADNNIQNDEQFSEELQLQSRNPGSLQWTTGLYYFRARSGYEPFDITFAQGLAPVGPGEFLTRQLVYSTQTTQSVAAYAQGTYAFSDKDHLTVGIRDTHEKRALDNASEYGTINDAITVPLVAGVSPSFSVNKPTWRVAFDHKFTDELMSYLSYNRGFKSGGYNVGNPAAAPFQTEQLDAYEIGVKSEFLEQRLRVNGAAFYYDYKNIQVARFVEGSQQIYNGAAATLYGLDLDMDAALSHHLGLNMGLEVMHDEFTNFPCADFFAGGPNISNPACSASSLPQLPYDHSAKGNKLPDTPNFTSSVTIDYHTDVFGGRGQIALTDAYNSGYSYEPNNSGYETQGAYNLINASASWAAPENRYRVRLWVKNLADKRYTSEIASSSTGDAVAYAPPRTYGVTIGATF